MTISEKIFYFLSLRHISQKDFSADTGISQSAISDWKRKGTAPSSDKILPICACLKISPEYLLSPGSIDHTVNIDYLTAEDTVLLEKYRNLPPHYQQQVLGYIDALNSL